MPPIDNSQWCQIVGNLVSIVADGPANDSDDYPDAVGLNGSITFTPLASAGKLIPDEGSSLELDRSYGVAQVKATIEDGELKYKGKPFVYLLSQADGISQPLAWNISFGTLVDGEGNRYSPETFNFITVPGGTLSLTRLAPSPGYEAQSPDRWALAIQSGQQAQQWGEQALESANSAKQSEVNSAESAASVSASASAAKTSETNAAQSAATATQASTAAQDAAATATSAAQSVARYSGTGSPEGKVTAGIGALYVDSAVTCGAVTWRKISGTGATGWRVENGETGWRDVSYLLSNATGKLLMARSGSQVSFYMEGVVPSSALTGGSAFVGTMPAGFRPTARRDFALPQLLSGSGTRSAFQFASGQIGAWSPSTSDKYYIERTWPTLDAWPASLPGTPA